jgi:hypothetical protein
LNVFLSGVCPVLCSQRGEYINGECQCNPGWKGKECQLRHDECEVPDCNGHGHCANGKCNCIRGYKGKFCEEGKAYFIGTVLNCTILPSQFFSSRLSASHMFGTRLLRRGFVHLQEGLEGTGLQPNGQGRPTMPSRLFRSRNVRSRHPDLHLRAQMVRRRLFQR